MKSALVSLLTAIVTVVVVLVLLEGARRRRLPDPVARLADIAFHARIMGDVSVQPTTPTLATAPADAAAA